MRAALSWEECKKLLDQLLVHYVGQQFPTANPNNASDFVVLRIFDEESNEQWRAGFYRFDADIMQIDEALQVRTAQAIPSTPDW